MGAVTYPNEAVAKFVDYNFIPVQIEVSNKELTQKFNVTWTPTILVLDADGKEHYRIVGFLAPEEFIATLEVGRGKWYFDTGRFAEARATFEEVIERCPYPNVIPEAIFFRGVAMYKATNDPKPLREAYDTLTAKYPQSEWAKRAEPYKLIS
jgi:tetratricopeptide (TPR) repeat protein